MEQYVDIPILKNLPLISIVMPYYDYAYSSVWVLRNLCKESRELWMGNQDAVARMLHKQSLTIYYKFVDESTIDILKKGQKYKLYKFIFMEFYEYNFIIQALDELPGLDIAEIILYGNNSVTKELIQRLAELPQFKTWQDLSKVMHKYYHESYIHLLILKAYKTTDTIPEFDWYSQALMIDEIKYDLNID